MGRSCAEVGFCYQCRQRNHKEDRQMRPVSIVFMFTRAAQYSCRWLLRSAHTHSRLPELKSLLLLSYHHPMDANGLQRDQGEGKLFC